MKKEITLKKMLLLVAVMFCGVVGKLSATQTITVSNGTVVAGSNYNTIQAAYNYVKALPALTEKYIIEIQGSYNPTTAPTLETFPITFTTNTASATNNITIKPATGAKITLSVPNQTTQLIATGTQSFAYTVASTIGLTNGMKIGGNGITGGTTITVTDATHLSLSASYTTSVGNAVCAGTSLATVTSTITSSTYSSGGANGANKVILASVTGMNVNDGITGTGVQTSTTISAINTGTNEITLSKTLNAQAVGTYTISTSRYVKIGTLTGTITAGDYIAGTGISAGTTVTTAAGSGGTLYLSQAATVSSAINISTGSNNATPTSVAGIPVDYFYGPAIASGTNYVSGIGSYAAGTFNTTTSTGLGSGSGTLNLPITTNSFASGARIFVGPAQKKALYFNGGDYITIDGVSRTDASTGLTIQNPNCIYAQTILFDNNSNYNTIKNCIIRGANQSGAWNNGYNGTIYFAGGQYNTINSNDVCDMGDVDNIPYPICAFQMTGAGGTNNNQTITNNNIYNITNLYSGNGNYAFMQFGSDANSVNNNISYNRFYWTTPTTFRTTTINFFGYATIGLGNRFDGNVLGYGTADGTGKSTLTFTGSGTIYAVAGMKNSTCKNNIIGGIDIVGTSFVGIQLSPHTAAISADSICYGNQVKDITVNCVANGTLYGIMLPSAPFSNVNIRNNTIKNLTISSSTDNIVNTVLGYSANFGSSGTIDINLINNEFSNLTAGNSGSSAANVVTGIVSGGCDRVFEKNLIYNLNTISTGTGSLIKGMRITLSVALTTKLVKNNIVRLGTDVTSDAEISAIFSDGLSSNSHAFNIYHNSIYIGGGAGLTLTKPSHCFSSPSGVNYGIITVKNNIFSNVRIGGAVNQVLNILSLPVINASSNNLYQYGTRFATIAPAATPVPYNLMSDWVTAKSPTVVETGSKNQTNPLFVDPTNATTPNLHVQTYSSAVAEQGAIGTGITDDYTGVGSRATTPALGAYEFTHTSQATDYFRSLASGNWGSGASWQSSLDNTNWATASSAPTSSAASVLILNAHEVTVAANATAPTLTVQGGGKLTLNDTYTLNATNLMLQSHVTNGTATFVDGNATGGLTVSGTKSVEQYLTTGRNWYISNPVAAVVPTVVSGTITLNTYDEAGVTDAAGATGWGLTTDALAVGKGYVAAVSADGNITFTGALNTGNKNILLTSRTGTANKAGFNLIGNPYPSYLDWDAVTAANVGKLRSTTMWYRTKMLNEASQLVYQFWTVNGDGIGVPNGASVKIPPMQSFWVRAVEGGGSLAVTNSMRSHAPATDKLLKAPAAKNVDRTLIRLQVSNGVNSDEAVVYFSANAQNGPDSYDSPKMTNGNNAIPEIYTVVGAEQLVINGMNAIPFNTELPLGFKTGTANNFSIKATEIANLSTDIKVVLKDKLLNIEQDISNGAQYSFTSDEVNSISRFAIVFKSAALINGVAENNDNNFALSVYKNLSNQIIVQNTGVSGQERLIIISNAMGQSLVTEVSTSSNIVIQKSFDPGIYLVTMQLPGKMITKKITIN